MRNTEIKLGEQIDMQSTGLFFFVQRRREYSRVMF